MKFPLYRKYINDKSYFKIESETAFTELKHLFGKQWEVNHFEAKNYFDRLYITQLIDLETAHFAESNASEYNTVLQKTIESK
jgi:hypothetical protein